MLKTQSFYDLCISESLFLNSDVEECLKLLYNCELLHIDS